jgi:FkbM family methyltransferase
MNQEHVRHRLVGTPLSIPLLWTREVGRLIKTVRHPELVTLFAEPRKMEKVLGKVITPSMNCIDIGCHIGSILDRIVKLAPNGTHFAFEPVPFKAAWLKAKYPKVDVRQMALGNEDSEVEFFLEKHNSALSGLRVNKSMSTDVDCIKVKVSTLDGQIPNSHHVDFIKLDVEGNELAVLKGATALIERCRPIILFECTLPGLEAYNIAPSQCFDFLASERRYDIYMFHDWLTGGEPLSVDQFDTSMRYPFLANNYLATPQKA